MEDKIDGEMKEMSPEEFGDELFSCAVRRNDQLYRMGFLKNLPMKDGEPLKSVTEYSVALALAAMKGCPLEYQLRIAGAAADLLEESLPYISVRDFEAETLTALGMIQLFAEGGEFHTEHTPPAVNLVRVFMQDISDFPDVLECRNIQARLTVIFAVWMKETRDLTEGTVLWEKY